MEIIFGLWYFTISVFYCLNLWSHLWTDNVCDGTNHAVIVFKMLKKIRSLNHSYSVVIIVFSVHFRNLPRLVKIVIPTVMLIYLSTVTSYFTVLTREEMTAHRWFGVVSFLVPLLHIAWPFVQIKSSCYTSFPKL